APTDNQFVGGQCRTTSAGAGRGFDLAAAEQLTLIGMNIDARQYGIVVGTGPDPIGGRDNYFYSVAVEGTGVTTAYVVDSDSFDNHFIGVGGNLTDAGTRTQFESSNNSSGGGSGVLFKLGSPLTGLELLSSGGSIASLTTAATGARAVTLPDASGTVALSLSGSVTITASTTALNAVT